MDRKKTQRIIGILVIIALFVLVLPLIFTSNGGTTQIVTAAATPPAFPESTESVTPVTAPEVVTPTSTSTPASPEQQPAAASVPAPDVQPIQQQAAALPAETPAAIPEKINTEIDIPKTEEITLDPKIVIPPPALQTAEAKTEPKANTKPDLIKLNNAAWVVQMGSFNNKANAHRLTNTLRAQGYKAFMREVRSATRVYVGPEFKKASAVALAGKIEKKINMRGIILPYQPLEL